MKNGIYVVIKEGMCEAVFTEDGIDLLEEGRAALLDFDTMSDGTCPVCHADFSDVPETDWGAEQARCPECGFNLSTGGPKDALAAALRMESKNEARVQVQFSETRAFERLSGRNESETPPWRSVQAADQIAELTTALRDTEWQARYLASRAFVGAVKRNDCEAALLVHCDNARAVLAKYQNGSKARNEHIVQTAADLLHKATAQKSSFKDDAIEEIELESKYVGTYQCIYEHPLTQEGYEGDAKVLEVLNVTPFTDKGVVVHAMVDFGNGTLVQRKFTAPR